MSEQRPTIGQLASQLMQKELETRDPIELQREMQREYVYELEQCVLTNKKNYPGDFFVVVITKKEPLLQYVFRNYFVARATCPTPDYDQTVFWYHADDEQVEYLWCIPDKETCLTFIDNKEKIVPEEQHLLQHILDYKDGSLYRLAKKLNKEHM